MFDWISSLSGKDMGYLGAAAFVILLGVSRRPLYRGFTGPSDETDRLSGREEKYVRIACVVIGILMFSLFAYRWSRGTWVIH